MSLARPLVKEKPRLLVRPLVRGSGAAIDPIAALNPILWFKASDGVLKTGGDPAGYLDTVPLWEDQSGNGNDAAQGTALNQPYYLPYDGVGYAHMGVSSINRLEVSLPSPWTGYNTLYAEVEIIGSTILSNTSIYTLLAIMGNTSIEEGFRMTLLSGNRVEFSIRNAAGTRLFVGVLDLTGLIISTDIIKLKLEVDEVNNTRTISYKINDGVWVVAVTGVYTIDGTFQYTSPKLFIGAVTGIAPSPILHFRSCLVKINNVDLVDINIERDATNNAASFVCGTGQTVSVVGAGNNPATIIKKARIRADGVDDSLLVAPVMPPMTTKNTIAWHGTVLNLSSQSAHPLTEMNGGANRFLLRMLQNGSLSAFLHNGTSSDDVNAPATNPVINGQIFTYIFVWDGASVNLYLDGELYYTTTTISVIPNTTPSRASIFAEYSSLNPSALDCMSCIQFPKALTPTEVAKLHTQLING